MRTLTRLSGWGDLFIHNLEMFSLLNTDYINPGDLVEIETIFSGTDCFLSLLRMTIGMTSSLGAKSFELRE